MNSKIRRNSGPKRTLDFEGGPVNDFIDNYEQKMNTKFSRLFRKACVILSFNPNADVSPLITDEEKVLAKKIVEDCHQAFRSFAKEAREALERDFRRNMRGKGK